MTENPTLALKFVATKPPDDVLNIDWRTLIDRRPDFFNRALALGGGYWLSVQCNKFVHCEPRANKADIHAYSTFEVGLLKEDTLRLCPEILDDAPHKFDDDGIWKRATVEEVQTIYRWLVWNVLWNGL